jgi:hypothetical protein
VIDGRPTPAEVAAVLAVLVHVEQTAIEPTPGMSPGWRRAARRVPLPS